MANRRRRLLVAAGVAASLALVVALALEAVHHSVSPERADRLLEEALGLPVQVGAVSLRWLPPAVTVRDVDAGPALRLAQARIELALDGLLRGRIALGELHLEDAEVAFLLRDDGGLAFATDEPGGTPLARVGGEDPGAFPDLHLRDAVVTLRAASGPRAPLRLELERLDLDQLPLWGARLRARLGIGEGGREGRVRLRARASSLAGFGGDPQDDPELALSLEARDLATLSLGTWLPGPVAAGIGPGPLDLELSLEGRRPEAFDTTLALARGHVSVGPLEIDAPATLSGRLVGAQEGLRLREGTFEAARVATPWARAEELRARLDWRERTLHVGSLDLEALRVEPGVVGREPALGFDLHVRKADRLALEGLELGAATVVPGRVEARGLEVTLDPLDASAGPGLALDVSRLRVEDLGPGRTARFSLEAADGEGGRLRVEGRYGPWSPEAPAPDQPLALVVEANGLGAARIAALLPSAWHVAAAPDTPLDVRLDLEGPRASALGGGVTLAIERGEVGIGELAAQGPGRLEGRFHMGGADRASGGPPSLEQARLEAAGVLFEGGRAGRTTARFAWREGRTRLEQLDLEDVAFDGRRLGAAPGEGAALVLRHADALSVRDLSLPAQEGTLPIPEALDARGCAVDVVLGLRTDAPALPLVLDTLEGRAYADARATLSLVGRLGAGEGAPLEGRMALEPFAPDAPLAPQIRELAVELSGAELGTLAGQLPEGVAPETGTGAGRLDVSLALAPAEGGGAAGPLRASLHEGSLRLAALRIPAPARLEMAVFLSDGVFGVDEATVEAAGGRWQQTGRLVLSDPPALDARIALEAVRLREVVAAAGEGSGEGTAPASPRLDASFDVAGPLRGGEPRFAGLRGEGRATLEGGMISSSALLAAVGRALGSRVGIEPRGDGPRWNRLESASATFRLADGRLASDDLRMVTDEYTLVGRGTVAVGGALALQTEVSFKPAGVAGVFKFLDLTQPVTGDLLQLPPVPVAVRGTLGEPSFHADPARLPVAWARALIGLPGRALDAVTEAGKSLGRGVGRVLRPGRSPEGPPDATGEPPASPTPR